MSNHSLPYRLVLQRLMLLATFLAYGVDQVALSSYISTCICGRCIELLKVIVRLTIPHKKNKHASYIRFVACIKTNVVSR